MKQNIYAAMISDIDKRIKKIHRNSHLFPLREAKPDPRMLLDNSIAAVCRGCVRKQPLVKAAEITGGGIKQELKGVIPNAIWDAAFVIRCGLFVLETYENLKVVELGKDKIHKSDKHPQP